MGEQAALVRDDDGEAAAAGAEAGTAGGSPELSAGEVRRLTLYAQGFIGAGAKRGGVAGVLRRVGAVQLDTISVLARSHELVAYAR
ncbi:MAG TPA: hypothetical protein VGD91_13435, partial [Trebonia sp.]